MIQTGSRLQIPELVKLSLCNLGEYKEGELGSIERFESNLRLLEEMYRNPNLKLRLEIDVRKEKSDRDKLLRIDEEGFLYKVFVYFTVNKKYYQKDGQHQDLIFTNSDYGPLDGEDLAEDAPTLATILFQNGIYFLKILFLN